MTKTNENKAAMYLVAIVGVVAAVGILVLILSASSGRTYVNDDLTGETYKIKSIFSTKGSISSTNTGESEKCCDYTPDGHCITKCH